MLHLTCEKCSETNQKSFLLVKQTSRAGEVDPRSPAKVKWPAEILQNLVHFHRIWFFLSFQYLHL